VVRFVQRLRTADLVKLPGVAETLDWSRALLALDRTSLDAETADATLGVLLKDREDIEKTAGAAVRKILHDMVQDAPETLAQTPL
jgi:hypothetical protein